MTDIYPRIQKATDHELRTVLAALCADSETTKIRTTRLFNRLDQVQKVYKEQQMPAPTLFICRNCQSPFREAHNKPDACHFHAGYVEIDYDSEAWVDCYGDEIHDSEKMRQDNPDGFMWSCEKGLDSPGCVRGAHKQPLNKAVVGTKRSSEGSGASESRKKARAEVIAIPDDE